ncbi:MAG: hypothetical protein ACK56I_10770, partial [bacterium]
MPTGPSVEDAEFGEHHVESHGQRCRQDGPAHFVDRTEFLLGGMHEVVGLLLGVAHLVLQPAGQGFPVIMKHAAPEILHPSLDPDLVPVPEVLVAR